MQTTLKRIVLACCLVLMSSPFSFSAEPAEKEDLGLADDITKESIVGPGKIQIVTTEDLLMSFGATARVIPTGESQWDFGMSKMTGGYVQTAPGVFALDKSFFRTHVNESGWVVDDYTRVETKIHFNAMPKDRKWSFYAALEFDKPLDTQVVDERGGRDEGSNDFGLERLHITYAMPLKMRLHAGWDIWHLDAFDAASMVYGDDNPGFWLTGEYDQLSFNIGYFKLYENNFQISPVDLTDEIDGGRNLYAGYLTWKPDKDHKIQLLYAFDRIRNAPARDFINYMTGGLTGINSGAVPETDSHHAGLFYIGTFGNLEFFAEGVYQFGSADQTGLSAINKSEDYDINAYALAADISFQFKGVLTGYPLKPHLGIMYTSGDDDPDDDKLGGYQGVENAQRFSARWGGENTIIGDTNLVMGSLLYGYIPELYGNGTPVFTGGLQNTAGIGGGRGDNPGLTMVSAGLTMAPRKYLIFKTNVNYMQWNEDFVVQNFVNPINPANGQPVVTQVGSGYAGTEWDNELTLATSKYSFIKAQASFLFPGDAVEDVTEALGAKSSDTAVRVAAEFILNF